MRQPNKQQKIVHSPAVISSIKYISQDIKHNKVVGKLNTGINEFKKELRQLTRNWNRMVRPTMSKVNVTSDRKVPMLNLTVNKKKETQTLLDTGSNFNVISQDFYEQLSRQKSVLKTRPLHSKFQLVTANNSLIDVTHECQLLIKIHSFTWKVWFVIVHNLSCNLILGVDFMQQHQLIIDFTIRNCYFKFNPDVKIPLACTVMNSEQCLNSFGIQDDEMEKEVYRLIQSYPNVFTESIGQALDLEVDLELIDATPVNIRPYFLSPPTLKKVKNIIDDWLEQDIIEPSTSPYSSPCFLTKKDRLVVNYGEVNKKLIKVNYPLGDLQNYHQHLQGAKYFTVIDLNKSFLQCPLSEKSRPITAFSTIFAKYQFKRVPFGLQIGSSTLSYYLDKIFHDIKFEFLLNFCDDIVIYSQDKTSHLQHLKEVIKRLSDHRLTVNQSKAKFFCTRISFLGNIIHNNTVTIDQDRTNNVRRFKPPKNVKQVRQFLGMVGFFAKHIKDYASICEPLFKLKRKNVKFQWSSECQKAFEKLKECITNPPILQLADFNKPFVLMTDASDLAAGGCLMQENENGDLLPIAYSKKFTDTERNYSVYEKEAYSVILCIEKWYEFLEVMPFKLVTDNQALSYVLNSKKKIGRLSRWVERLLALPFTVEFRKSEDNMVADALSRLFSDNDPSVSNDINVLQFSYNQSRQNRPKGMSYKVNKLMPVNVNNEEKNVLCNMLNEIPLAFTDIKQHQMSDAECIEIIDSVHNQTNHKCFELKNDVLMFKDNRNKLCIYLPEKLVNLVFCYYHNSILGGHLGIAHTYDKIRKYFYRPNLYAVIKDKVKNCKICLMSKSTQRKFEGQLISSVSKHSMHCIFVDLVGPLVRSKLGNCYILVAVDAFSKFVWVSAIRDSKTCQIVNKLEQIIFNNFGIPQILVTDNASYFMSHEFKLFTFKNFINHRTIAPYRACSNQAERHIRNLTTLLRCYYNKCQNNWDKDLCYVQLSLNTAKNSSTGYTAFELMFNHECNNSLSNIWNLNDLINENVNLQERKSNLNKAIINVKKSIKLNQKRAKYQEPNCKHPYKLGSTVYIKTHFLSDKFKKFSKKLAYRYDGPYKIIYFMSPVTVLVQRIDDVTVIKKVHIIDLKLGT